MYVCIYLFICTDMHVFLKWDCLYWYLLWISCFLMFYYQEVGTIYTHHQKTVIVDADAGHYKRKIMAFVGGLDLCMGWYDTPKHPLFRTLQTVHKDDYCNTNFTVNHSFNFFSFHECTWSRFWNIIILLFFVLWYIWQRWIFYLQNSCIHVQFC